MLLSASILPENEPSDGGGSVRRLAYDRFQRLLLSGRLRPGHVISQRELVAMLDISLGALRELLPRLEAEGLLTVMPQRGIQITAVDLKSIRNAYQMRMAFEREAVSSAIQIVSDEELRHQKALHLDVLERAARGADQALLEEAQSVDAGMHAFLIEATGNDMLIQAYGIVSIRVRLINVDRMRLTPEVLPAALGEHIRILDALLARDETAALATMREHIESARARAVSF